MQFLNGCTCAPNAPRMGQIPRLVNEDDLLTAILAGAILSQLTLKHPPVWLQLGLTLITAGTLVAALARAFSPIGAALQAPPS